MYAARAQHLKEVVRPALHRGELVVSDRFNDASIAYQGYGRELGAATVHTIDQIICGPIQPHLTLVLDLVPGIALARAHGREVHRKSKHGRFEAQGLNFHQRVRRGYLTIAKQEPARVKLINADRPVREVQAEIRVHVDLFLAKQGLSRKRKSASNGKGRKAKVTKRTNHQ